MSQNLSEQVEKELRELREDRAFYFTRFRKTKANSDKIRYAFLNKRYYEILVAIEDNQYNRRMYELAVRKYESLFPDSNTFSMNRNSLAF